MKAIYIEDLQMSKVRVDELGAQRAIYRQDPAQEKIGNGRCSKISSWLGYTWFVELQPVARKLTCFILGLASLLVIMCECTSYWNFQQNYLE